MNFQELKSEVLRRAKEKGACKEQYARAYKSETCEELAEVIKDNLGWNNNNDILTHDLISSFDNKSVFDNGKGNVGLFNSGNFNSGNFNSGNFNSGNRNSGNRNSGNFNSGYYNSGDCNNGNRNSGNRNSGDYNSGDYNNGNCNSGDCNSGNFNSGYYNSGDCNSGYYNSGDCNSGDFNSGYRNSGVFCSKKNSDTISIFNKDSEMTWSDWVNHPAKLISSRLIMSEWVCWDEMTEQEKEENPKAYVCGGYIKEFGYKESWANLWITLSEEEKKHFYSLPNFSAEIFEEITGIKV